ncbi:NAD-dependent epimerase/dehydratase family protein [Deinococcus sonorensis]|uniref:NAD-dependent epimerase/dehydratase family protein n=2 Tax=Deinococcus sonorensis TaxID=309891 RepID=A0AAU7UCN8_9DEIO
MKLALDSKIFVTGHNEVVGGAIVRHLRQLGYHNIVVRDDDAPAAWEPAAVNAFFEAHLPDYVFLAPISLGGVLDDSLTPATWLRQALMMMSSVIHAAYLYESERLLCIDCDPTLFDARVVNRDADYLQAELIAESQRAREAASTIMTELCDSYRTQYGCHFSSAVATGLYGPGLRLDAPRGNLVSALFRKVIQAAETGQPQVQLHGHPDLPCEALYIDDLADACLFLIEQLSEPGTIGIRQREPHTLVQLAECVGRVTGYTGRFCFDDSTPLPPPRRQGDPERLIRAGWVPDTSLEGGFRKTYRWYQRHAGTVSTV